MAIIPKDRCQSADEWLAAMDAKPVSRLMTRMIKPLPSVEMPAPRKSRSRLIGGVAAVALAAVAGATVLSGTADPWLATLNLSAPSESADTSGGRSAPAATQTSHSGSDTSGTGTGTNDDSAQGAGATEDTGVPLIDPPNAPAPRQRSVLNRPRVARDPYLRPPPQAAIYPALPRGPDQFQL